MSPSIEEQIEGLKNIIAEMEAQRQSLSDEIVDNALAPIKCKLDELVALLRAQQARPTMEPAQQRKLVTLLFMDVAGSTAIAQHMDPEDVSEVFDVALKRLAAPVEAHGGHVTRFMGDGFLAVFGAPLAREADPEQAIRAGLAILNASQEMAPELSEKWGIPDFRVRVGINTGLVMLGGQTEAGDTLMGAAVNLAARLESAAPPGGMLISHETYRHVRGLFDVEQREPIQAKGFDEPVQVYRVLAAKPRAFHTYTRGVEGVETRMIGRHNELKYLQDALLSAIEEGEGQVVTVSGEAGVGKSRLLYEFQNWIELLPQEVLFFEGRGRQEAQGQPYALLRDLFTLRFQIQDSDRAEQAREKIEAGFAEAFGVDEDGEMRTHILGHLLGFDFSSSKYLKSVLGDPEQLRNRGRIYLAEYFKQRTNAAPVVVFLEDIHWADDSSLDVLNWLGERIQRQRLLLVCDARRSLFERRPYWGEGLEFHHLLELEPLSKSESRQLVGEIFRLADHIPAALRDLVVEGSEGNPFYLEEMVKMLVENGVIDRGDEAWQVHPERMAQIEVPQTLVGVLQARLDSLPIEERVVLQQASVVGRQFWDRVVAHLQAAGDSKPQLVPEALNSLRARELVYRREESTFAEAHEYFFKHDILREVTYASVLKRLRRVYHGLVADWLISQGAERAREYSGMIAEHLLLAGREDQAGEYFLHAGQDALKTYANSEAEVHFRKASGLLESKSQRAACLAGLGETLGRQGSTEEAERMMRQAIELYHEMGEVDRLATLYTRLSKIIWFDDYQKAWEICQEGMLQQIDVGDSPGLAYLLAEAGRTAFFCQPREEAIALGNRAIEMAERLNIVEAWALASICLSLTKDDAQDAIEILEEVAELSEEHGLLQAAAEAYLNLSYFLWMSLGGAEQGFRYSMKAAEIRRQIADFGNLIMALWNSLSAWVSLGHLKSVDFPFIEFLHQSRATEAQVKWSIQIEQAYCSIYKGDWEQAIVLFRDQLEKIRKGGNFQDITDWNRLLVETILELHRFAGLDYLAEAEAALLENINFKWALYESYFMLATISARKGNIPQAYEYLSEVTEVRLFKQTESYRLKAEIELGLVERRWDRALAACQTLIDIYQAGGYRWEWARQLIDKGDALLGRDGPGDREEAQKTYRQGLAMFGEMGAPGYAEVVEGRLSALTDYPSE